MTTSLAAPAAPSDALPPARLSIGGWIAEGLRAGVLLRPRITGQDPAPMQLVAIVLLVLLLEVALARLEVAGPAQFSPHAWLAPWWSAAASALLFWALLRRRRSGPPGLPAWLALWLVGALVPGLVSQGLAILQGHDALPLLLQQSEAAAWGTYLALWAWTLAVALRLAWHFGLGRRALAVYGAGLLALFGLTVWHFPDRPWTASPEAPRPVLSLSQERIEAQQAAWTQAVEGLAFGRPGVVDVYGLVFAPYALEDVFLRESTMVADVLARRFDAQGRVLHLVNHAATSDTHGWATPLNLARGIEAIAHQMDPQEDLLVVYLTSHGASNFRLEAAHPPLEVPPVGPSELRRLLDDAGIRHRVVAVSACFSGGWIAPLASPTTLVMTAADADSTSYGCGAMSELTFFGRALFHEQLRRTHSFEQAFAAAVPLIRQREEEAGKPDGFSNPQISVGEGIRPVLRALEQRLQSP